MKIATMDNFIRTNNGSSLKTKKGFVLAVVLKTTGDMWSIQLFHTPFILHARTQKLAEKKALSALQTLKDELSEALDVAG